MIMKPTIHISNGGKISIDNRAINYDFFINAEGEIVRRKQLITAGESVSLNTLTLSEAQEYYDPAVNEMVIGCEDFEKLVLSSEAVDFFDEHRLKIKLLPIQEAAIYWNRYEGRAVGLFHLPMQ
jgi:hypothetical protein